MSLVSINWRPQKAELQKFGIVTLIGFLIIGLFLLIFSESPVKSYYAWGVGVIIGLPALSGIRSIAMPGYILWMGIAFIMGNIISRLILLLVYYLCLTPLALLGKVVGRDRLQLKKAEKTTYWENIAEVSDDKSNYERQF